MDEKEARERILGVDWHRAKEFKEPFNAKAVRYYRLYKNWKDPALTVKRLRAGRSTVQIAKAAEFVETKLPRYIEALFANAPEYVVMQPRERDDEKFAPLATKLMNFWMDQANIITRLVTGGKEACVVGTFVGMPQWIRKDIERKRWVDFAEYLKTTGEMPAEQYWTDELRFLLEQVGGDPTQLPMEALQAHMAPMMAVDTSEGPQLEAVPFIDFYPDPRARDFKLEGARFAIRRFRMTKAELAAVNKSMKAKGLPNRYKNLDKLDENGGAVGEQNGQSLYHESVGNSAVQDNRDRTHDLLEYWCMDDGYVYTFANEDVLIRSEPWPHWHGNLPFVLFVPHPDLYSPFGISIFEWIEDELEDLSETARAARDLMNLQLHPPYFVTESAIVDPFDYQNLRPGKLIRLEEGMNARDAVTPFPLPQTWPQAQADIQAIGQRLDNVTGLNQPLRGQPITRRTTVGEQQILVEEGNARLKLDIRILNESFKAVANHFLWLGQQLMPPAMSVRVTGEEGETRFEEISRDNIDRNFDIFPASSSIEALANRGQQAQALVNYMNTIVNTPLMQMTDWGELGKTALQLFGIRSAGRILPDKSVKMAQAQALMQHPEIGPMIVQASQQILQQQMSQQAPPVGPEQQNPGSATPAQQAGRTEEEQAMLENEQLLLGNAVPVDPREPHEVHLQFHMQGVEAGQAEGMDIQPLQQHIQQHMQALEMRGGMASEQGTGPAVPQGFGNPAAVGTPGGMGSL